MEGEELTLEDIDLIIESLEHTKQAVREYTDYPDYEFKQQRLAAAQRAQDRMRALKKRMKEGHNEGSD